MTAITRCARLLTGSPKRRCSSLDLSERLSAGPFGGRLFLPLIRLRRVAVVQTRSAVGGRCQPACLHVVGSIGGSCGDKSARRCFGFFDQIGQLLHASSMGVAVVDDLFARHEVEAILRDDAESRRIAHRSAACDCETCETGDPAEFASDAIHPAVPTVRDQTHYPAIRAEVW